MEMSIILVAKIIILHSQEEKKKREIVSLSSLQYSGFCLMQFTSNVKTSSTESVYLHNLHRAALTQKKENADQLFLNLAKIM